MMFTFLASGSNNHPAGFPGAGLCSAAWCAGAMHPAIAIFEQDRGPAGLPLAGCSFTGWGLGSGSQCEG